MYKIRSNETSEEMKNCQGHCIIEMEKIFGHDVVVDFLKVERDLHNDDKILEELKNAVLSTAKEALYLIHKKIAELTGSLENGHFNHRQKQLSFHNMCHKIVRKDTAKESHSTDKKILLPDKSKCICYSDENMKKYNISRMSDSYIKLISNLDSLKDVIGGIYVKFQCKNCDKFSCMDFGCDCTSPSNNSLYNVHKYMLESCTSEDPSLSLTHLKKDAEYYKTRTEISSTSSEIDSVESFEVISPKSDEESPIAKELAHCHDYMFKNENISNQMTENCEQRNVQAKSMNDSDIFSVDLLHEENEDDIAFVNYCENYDNYMDPKLKATEHHYCQLNDKKEKFCQEPQNTVLHNDKSFPSENLSNANPLNVSNRRVGLLPVVLNLGKNDIDFKPLGSRCNNSCATPADIIKQSFSTYLSNTKHVNALCPDSPTVASVIRESASSLGVNFKSTKKDEVSDDTTVSILKRALNVYFGKESPDVWLRKEKI